jgi:hypothetical protein
MSLSDRIDTSASRESPTGAVQPPPAPMRDLPQQLSSRAIRSSAGAGEWLLGIGALLLLAGAITGAAIPQFRTWTSEGPTGTIYSGWALIGTGGALAAVATGCLLVARRRRCASSEAADQVVMPEPSTVDDMIQQRLNGPTWSLPPYALAARDDDERMPVGNTSVLYRFWRGEYNLRGSMAGLDGQKTADMKAESIDQLLKKQLDDPHLVDATELALVELIQPLAQEMSKRILPKTTYEPGQPVVRWSLAESNQHWRLAQPSAGRVELTYQLMGELEKSTGRFVVEPQAKLNLSVRATLIQKDGSVKLNDILLSVSDAASQTEIWRRSLTPD